MEDLVKLLSAFLAPLTAVTAVTGTWIAIQQYRLSREKFKHELYDRRSAIFKATMQFISEVMVNADVDHNSLFKLMRDTADCDFLFDREIREFVDEVYRKGAKVHATEAALKGSGLGIGPEREKLAAESAELFTWFERQFETGRQRFKKYLTLKH
jgi:hypothetical protein